MTSENPISFGPISVTQVISEPPFFENGYLIHDRAQNSVIAIDPGASAAQFGAEIDKLGAHLQAIWLTHGHPDHIAGAARLMKDHDVACWAHHEEKAIIDMAAELAGALMMEAFEPLTDCRYFEDATALRFAEKQVKVLHAPGHTPGGVVFAFDGFALTGDTLFNQGVGRTDLPGGDTQQLVSSIDRLLLDLDPQTVLFSGHGPTWTVAEARPWWAWMKSQSGMF